MSVPRGFIGVAWFGRALAEFIRIQNHGHALNDRQIGLVIVYVIGAALVYAMWLTPGGWTRDRPDRRASYEPDWGNVA